MPADGLLELAADHDAKIQHEEEYDDVVDEGGDTWDGNELLDPPQNEGEAYCEAEAKFHQRAGQGKLKESIGDSDANEGDRRL